MKESEKLLCPHCHEEIGEFEFFVRHKCKNCNTTFEIQQDLELKNIKYNNFYTIICFAGFIFSMALLYLLPDSENRKSGPQNWGFLIFWLFTFGPILAQAHHHGIFWWGRTGYRSEAPKTYAFMLNVLTIGWFFFLLKIFIDIIM